MASSFFDSMLIVGNRKVTRASDIGKKVEKDKDYYKQSAYDRTKAQVYATGNKWAIENFHATHD